MFDNSRALAFICVVAVMAGLFPAARAQTRTKEPSELERALAWKGAKVHLLPVEPDRRPDSDLRFIGGDGSCVRLMSGKKSLLSSEYGGREGIITEVEPNGTDLSRLIVDLSGSGERVAFSRCGLDALGFVAEHERAEAFIGKTVWAKGNLKITPPEEWAKLPGLRTTFETRNIEPLVVTEVRWGFGPTPSRPVVLCVRNTAGNAGCLLESDSFGNTKQYVFDLGFKTEYDAVAVSDIIYLEDPRTKHPTWSAAIWKLIEDRRIAIGMTLEMAQLACGSFLYTTGAQIDEAGNASDIVSCMGLGGRFLLKDGKIAQQVTQ
jgi:hypothetical protein